MATRKRREIPLAAEIELLRRQLTMVGDDPKDLEETLRYLTAMRSASKGAASEIDRCLVAECVRLRRGLAEAEEVHKKLRELHEEMEKPPWYPATYLGPVNLGGRSMAMVHYAGARRAVTPLESVDLDAFGLGDEVLLDSDLNLVVGGSSNGVARAGETALFNRSTPDGRMVLDWHDEEIIVDVADQLKSQQLANGDRVRFDRALWMAMERIERAKTSKFLLEDTPSETFAQIGGLDAEIKKIQHVIGAHLRHPGIVQRYRAQRKNSILLVGAPGNGKTMAARATANWLAELSTTGVRFMNVKPAELHSVWYSQTEANYREVFEVARMLGETEPDIPVVVFFDEVDAVGGVRGRSLQQTDDRVLNAFMIELDGLKSRGNVLVMAATNRVASLDPGLSRPGRLGDEILHIPRPGRRAAGQIFREYLEPDIPYAADSDQGGIINAALTRIYAPNSDNKLARLMLRGGEQVSVLAKDLISGAGIRNIVNGAKDSAVLREAATGSCGLSLGDMMSAIEREFASLVGMLTPETCRTHIPDLPDDADVVRIERVDRNPKNGHRFLTVA